MVRFIFAVIGFSCAVVHADRPSYYKVRLERLQRLQALRMPRSQCRPSRASLARYDRTDAYYQRLQERYLRKMGWQSKGGWGWQQ